MSKILLAGDSWGIGTYQGKGNNYKPTGKGIQSILEYQGHQVTNVSHPGISNRSIITRIPYKLDEFDYIVFLQTDILRENSYHGPKGKETSWRWLREDFIDELMTADTIESYINEHFNYLYSKLNRIGPKIICLGGWSDLHPSITAFDNLVPLIPSITQLLVPKVKEQVYISDFEYFVDLSKDKKFMDKFNSEFKQIAIQSSHKFEESCRAWDDVHPNIEGYQLVVDQLLTYFAKK